jgi:predicted phosphoribosyltransferase
MRFTNREKAASLLAEELRRFKSQHPLVLGIPRGGVPIAKIVADHLGCDFDLVLVHKLRTPGQPDLAMGAVDEGGQVFRFGARSVVSPELYADEVAEQVAEIRRRRKVYSAARTPISPTGHTAIIVDDGLATGARSSPQFDRCGDADRCGSWPRCPSRRVAPWTWQGPTRTMSSV